MKKLFSLLLVLLLCLGLLSLAALAEDEAAVPEITAEAAGSEPEEMPEELPADAPEETPGEEDPAEPAEPAAEEILPAAEPAPGLDAAGGRENAGGDGKYRTEETPSSVLADAAALDGFDIIQGFYLELVRSELNDPGAGASGHTFLLDYPDGFDRNDCRVYCLSGGTAEVLSDVGFGPCIELNGLSPDNGEHIALAWNAVSDPGPGGQGGPGGDGLYPEIYEETPAQALVDRAAQDGYEHTAGYILTHNLNYQDDNSGHIGEGMNRIDYPAGMDSSITDWKVYQLYDGTVTEANAELGGEGIILRVRDVDLGRENGEPYGPRFVVAWNGTAGMLIESSFTREDDDDSRTVALRRAIQLSGFDSGCMYAVSTMDKRTVSAGEYDSFRLWCPDDMDAEKPWGLFLYRDGRAVDVTDRAAVEQHKNSLALAVRGLDVQDDDRFALGLFTYRSDRTRVENKAAGVIVTGELSGAAELRVTPITSGEGYALVQQQAGVTKLRVYDISLIKDGVEIQPSGWVRVTMSLPAGYDPDRTVLFHVEDDGTVMPIRFALTEDGRITFETDSFSLYALGLMEQTAQGDLNGDGAADRLDRIYFARCLAGRTDHPAPEHLDPALADLNGDERVDLQDRSLLARMLAAEDPTFEA